MKWRNLRFGALAVLALAASERAAPAEAGSDVQALFAKANELLQEKKFAEALPLYQELAQKVPNGSGVFANMALAAEGMRDHELAVRARLRFLELRPDDPQQMGSLMGNYQALGKLAERDAQREKIFARWNALPPADKDRVKAYVRDEFDAGGVHFIVTEYFAPAAPVNRIYRFDAVDSARKILYFFGLETGDPTTNIARELGTIKKDERIYSLDRYETKGQMLHHASFGLMSRQPDYDTVRVMVVNAVEGRLPAASSSVRPIP